MMKIDASTARAVTLVLALAAAHCSSSNASPPAAGGALADASAQADGQWQDVGSTLENATDAGDGSCGLDPGIDGALQTYTADNANIQYFGRIDTSNPLKPRFPASAVYITAKFRGDSVAAKINDQSLGGSSNFFDIFIDDRPPAKLIPAQLQITYDVTPRDGAGRSLLSCGVHTVTVLKRTEADVGYTEFRGFEFAEILPPDSPPTRKIEIIGDSITCGAGVEATSANAAECAQNGIGAPGYGQGVENGDEAYGVVLAKGLQAQWRVVCAGGIGLLRNYYSRAAYDPRTMRDVYLNLYPEDMSSTAMWDYKQWTPDVIVIGLGTNDFSNVGDGDGGLRVAMTQGEFEQGLTTFVGTLQGYYPGVTIVLVSSPILGNDYPNPGDTQLTDDQAAVQAAASFYADAGGRVYAAMVDKVAGTGCGGHPNVIQQAAAANKTIVPVIKAAMNW
jgi:lysophospholipase L1-like esterase